MTKFAFSKSVIGCLMEAVEGGAGASEVDQ